MLREIAYIFIIGDVCLLTGCGSLKPTSLDSLLSREPYVVSVEPTAGSVAKPDSRVAIEFSEPINHATVDAKTLAVVKDEGVAATKATDDLVVSIVNGEKDGIEGVYEFEGEGRVAVFRPLKPYDAGAYKVVATDKILSVDMLPLNQGTGRGPKAFVSTFIVEDSKEADNQTIANSDTSTNSNQSTNSGSTSAGENTSVSSNSGNSGNDSSDNGSGNTDSTDNNSDTSEIVANVEIRRPNFLIINELLYDISGEDTNGQVFVELAGEPGTDVSGYKMLLVSGDDGVIKDTLDLPKDAKIPDEGIFLIADSMTGQKTVSQVQDADLILNFDPQNGPDCVQLLDNEGKLLDALGYGSPIVSLAKNNFPCVEGTPTGKVKAGSSLSRTDAEDADNNAIDFKELKTPTPGVR